MSRAFRCRSRTPLVLFCCLLSIGFFCDRARAEKLYMIGFPDGTISRSDLDGSNHEVVVREVDGFENPVSLAIDAGGAKMYWSDRQLNKIKRANLDGTNIEAVLTSAGTSPYSAEIEAQ